MFQRIKGAIDSTIAAEQARQKAAQLSPRSSSTAKRPTSRAASPAVRPSRPKRAESRDRESSQRGPDPKEFDPEFVIDNDDTPSRAQTPIQIQIPAKDGEAKVEERVDEKPQTLQNGSQSEKDRGLDEREASAGPEMSTEVRAKLRKLERLEPRYHDLLRSYRIAHARVSIIEPFETSLREITPLTSINDPGAFVEYLNQIKLRGDMVLEELKRVTSERASFKGQLEEAEKTARDAWDEVAKLRGPNTTAGDIPLELNNTSNDDESRTTEGDQVVADSTNRRSLDNNPASAPASTKPKTPQLPVMSMFSPRSKAPETPKTPEETEEFFSYDGEIPRLEAELKVRQGEVLQLQTEVGNLKSELDVARESTQTMVQTLEQETRKLSLLHEQQDKYKVDSAEQRQASELLVGSLRSDLEAADANLRQMQAQKDTADVLHAKEQERLIELSTTELKRLQNLQTEPVASMNEFKSELSVLKEQISSLELEKDQGVKRVDTLNNLVSHLRATLSKAEEESQRLQIEYRNSLTTIEPTHSQMTVAGETSAQILPQISEEQKADATEDGAIGSKLASDASSTKNKSKKKRKKGAKSSIGATAGPSDSTVNLDGSSSVLDESIASDTVNQLQNELKNLQILLEEKDAAIERLHAKLKDGEEMKEEIDSLRDNLVNMGQDHIADKDRIKELVSEKHNLESTVSDLETELSALRAAHTTTTTGSEQVQKELTGQFDELKLRTATLQTDLLVAQQLASSRFKDLADLRIVLQKAQPELAALKIENKELKALKDELTPKLLGLQEVEARHDSLRLELTDLNRALNNRDAEIKALHQKISHESVTIQKAEDAGDKVTQELQRSETERKLITQSLDKTSRDLMKCREEINHSRVRIREVEEKLNRAERERGGLKEEIDLKAAQYASAESLMCSMRDQTAEMAVQTKEARERCESLEEELADTHRLLNERTREAETMRRLLAEVEGRTDSRMREMKDRMDIAIEERDKAEDEASTVGRRRVREIEDLRTKLRDVERGLKRAEDDKEELEVAQREWKKRREDLELQSAHTMQEAGEVRQAMSQLRDALDESEQQARELEKHKTELSRSVEEMQTRLDKLQQSNKSMVDELKSMQASTTRNGDSQALSPRPSSDSSQRYARVTSPGPKASRPAVATHDQVHGTAASSMDYVYLKNVLLQFLEQRDKKHQVQLIPVLGMLLHFNRQDEQKWMAAVTAK